MGEEGCCCVLSRCIFRLLDLYCTPHCHGVCQRLISAIWHSFCKSFPNSLTDYSWWGHELSTCRRFGRKVIIASIAEFMSLYTLKPCCRVTSCNLPSWRGLEGLRNVPPQDVPVNEKWCLPFSYLRKWLTFLDLWILSSFVLFPSIQVLLHCKVKGEKKIYCCSFSKQTRKNSSNSRAQHFSERGFYFLQCQECGCQVWHMQISKWVSMIYWQILYGFF